jgi:PhnB protein
MFKSIDVQKKGEMSMTTKSNPVRPIPEGYYTVTPWIVVRGAAQLLDYMKEAFGAEEIARIYVEDGAIGHAEVRIGDSVVMMFDAKEQWPETPSFIRLYVEDGDAVYQRALAAGGTSVTEMTELFFGDRVGRVRDPFGNIWWIQTRIEDVEPGEMARRAQEQTHIAAMQYVQSSLDRELSSRSRK